MSGKPDWREDRRRGGGGGGVGILILVMSDLLFGKGGGGGGVGIRILMPSSSSLGDSTKVKVGELWGSVEQRLEELHEEENSWVNSSSVSNSPG